MFDKAKEVLSDIFLNLSQRLKKKEEEMPPYEYGIVELSDTALQSGIDDEHNKILRIIKNGRVEKEMPYSEKVKNAFEEVYEIPIVDIPFENEEEEYEWDTATDFGFTRVTK